MVFHNCVNKIFQLTKHEWALPSYFAFSLNWQFYDINAKILRQNFFCVTNTSFFFFFFFWRFKLSWRSQLQIKKVQIIKHFVFVRPLQHNYIFQSKKIIYQARNCIAFCSLNLKLLNILTNLLKPFNQCLPAYTTFFFVRFKFFFWWKKMTHSFFQRFEKQGKDGKTFFFGPLQMK